MLIDLLLAFSSSSHALRRRRHRSTPSASSPAGGRRRRRLWPLVELHLHHADQFGAHQASFCFWERVRWPGIGAGLKLQGWPCKSQRPRRSNRRGRPREEKRRGAWRGPALPLIPDRIRSRALGVDNQPRLQGPQSSGRKTYFFIAQPLGGQSRFVQPGRPRPIGQKVNGFWVPCFLQAAGLHLSKVYIYITDEEEEGGRGGRWRSLQLINRSTPVERIAPSSSISCF